MPAFYTDPDHTVKRNGLENIKHSHIIVFEKLARYAYVNWDTTTLSDGLTTTYCVIKI